MATDVARSIVNEARLQHRCEMSKSASQSRAILRLKALKSDPPEPQPTFYREDDDHGPLHFLSDVHESDHALGKSSNGKVVLRPAFEIANTQVIAHFLSQKFLQERQKAEEQLKEDRIEYNQYDYEDEVEDPEQLVHGQVYVQLLRNECSPPVFSLQCNSMVTDMVIQIGVLLELFLAGQFVNGEED